MAGYGIPGRTWGFHDCRLDNVVLGALVLGFGLWAWSWALGSDRSQGVGSAFGFSLGFGWGLTVCLEI